MKLKIDLPTFEDDCIKYKMKMNFILNLKNKSKSGFAIIIIFRDKL